MVGTICLEERYPPIHISEISPFETSCMPWTLDAWNSGHFTYVLAFRRHALTIFKYDIHWYACLSCYGISACLLCTYDVECVYPSKYKYPLNFTIKCIRCIHMCTSCLQNWLTVYDCRRMQTFVYFCRRLQINVDDCRFLYINVDVVDVLCL